MKKYPVFLFFLFLNLVNEINGQVLISSCTMKKEYSHHYNFNPGQMPVFPGGDSALQQFFSEKLVLNEAQKKQADGLSLRILFNVEENGLINNVRILKGSGAGLSIDSLALAVFCSMPAWIPGGETADSGNVVRPAACYLSASLYYPSLAKNETFPKVIINPMPAVSHFRSEITEEVFDFAEMAPSFPGGMVAYYNYLEKNMRYPEEEKSSGKEGVVYVSFVVEKDGSISNIYFLKGVEGAPGFNAEAIRLIEEMPDWNPGKMNGRPTRIRVNMPVKFKIQ